MEKKDIEKFLNAWNVGETLCVYRYRYTYGVVGEKLDEREDHPLKLLLLSPDVILLFSEPLRIDERAYIDLQPKSSIVEDLIKHPDCVYDMELQTTREKGV